MVSSSFSVGQGNWWGPEGPVTVNYSPPKDRAPDEVYTQPTSSETALLYRLNGDYNPLHADPTVGAQLGFKGVIMHGLSTWNTAAHAVLKKFGGSQPERLRVFQARFAKPVVPGDTVVVEMWRTGKEIGNEWFEEIVFVAKVKETGTVVLSNKRAVVKVVGGKGCSKL